MRRLRILSCIVAASSSVSTAQQPTPPPADLGPHRIPAATAPIVVDGDLEDPAWREAWSMELAYEVQPGENVAPPVRTVVLATYDEGAVYFAFRAYDPDPGAIRAHLSDRDSIGGDDWVGVVLDTFDDQRRSFDFLVNPLGVQEDFVEAINNGEGGAWDAIWESAGRVTPWGYAVEMRIPFSSLRFQRTEGAQRWGFDAVRSYPRIYRHHIGLFPRQRGNNCYLCQAVKIEGFEGVTPGRNLELVPTLTATRSDQREELPDGPMVGGDTELDAGITARWGMTPNLTLSGTVNPDFSQVEADARQLEVNERFALFYPEKRPFFMEGADFFSTRLQVLHTRTMYDPSWGLKLTGKEGDHTLGLYLVEDESTGLLFPSSQGSDSTVLDQESLAAVARYKRDIGDHLTLGGMLTQRQGEDYSNSVVELEGFLRLTDRDRVQLEVVGSRTEYPDAVAAEYDQPEGSFSDWAVDLLYVRDTRNVDLWALYQRVGEDFRSDLGFNPQVGHTAYLAGAEYEWIPVPDGWYSHLEVGTEYIDMRDADGELLSRENSLSFYYEGALQSHTMLHLYRREEVYDEQHFSWLESYFHLCMTPNGDSELSLNLYWGDRIDYANTQLGERLRVVAGGSYRLGRHLSFDVELLNERMTVDEGHLYTARIAQGTVIYQLSTRSFLRAVLQYVDNTFNVDLYDDRDLDSEQREAFAQLLYSYKLNPQTVLFLGYTEGSVGSQDFSLTTANRTYFAKVGYAWQL